MITRATLTGEVKDDFYVQVVTLQGVHMWATPAFSFPVMGMPTKEWVNKYKKGFLALVDFVDDRRTMPVFIGLIPNTSGKIPSETVNGNTFILTEKFRLRINDKDNYCLIDSLDDGEILFGDEKVSEPLILGNSWKDFMDSFIEEIGKSTVSTGIGQMPLLNAANILKFKLQLEKLLSKKVKTK
jgi:hypothetical protein